ncbi:MAG: hypothetical protein HUU57_15695, partial [Bdellovibrio sp.]|nr:hypothetical protein [Bdellovibrio sp.]
MKKHDDLNSVLAFLIIPAILLTGWFFSLNGSLDQRTHDLSLYFSKNGEVFTYKVGFNLLISVLLTWAVASYFGLGEFGRKISQYKKGNKLILSKRAIIFIFIGILVGSVLAFLGMYFSIYESIKPLPAVIPEYQKSTLSFYLYSNLFLIGLTACIGIYRVFVLVEGYFVGNIAPIPSLKNALILGASLTDGKEKWVVIGKSGLVTGIMLVASTGGGKSIACLVPWTKQFMLNFDPFPSIIIIDPKDTFARAILKIAKDLGLLDRVVHFTLDGNFKTNPIYRPQMLKDSGLMYVAGFIRAATINFMGAEEGDQKFWGSKGNILIKNLIAYCAAKYNDYFTLKDFYQEMIEASDRDFGTEMEVFLESDKYDWEEKRNLEIARDYFEFEYANLDTKIKDSIGQTATSFLAQIREARIERVFCPAKEEINFWGFDEIVDEGKIFVFGIDVPGLSGPLSVLMKLMYQGSVMDRIKKPKRLENKRLSVGIYDEYQTFVSLGGGQIEGDDDYAAKRREAMGVTIVATQSHSSLLQATGSEVGTDVLVANFRTRIIGATSDARTINHYKEIAGEVEEVIESDSYTESGQKPIKQILGTGLYTSDPTVSQSLSLNTQKRSRISGETMSQLKTFEAIGVVFNGVDTEFHDKICLKPAFLPTMRVPHKKVIEMARAAAMACLLLFTVKSHSFPSVCSAVKSQAFESCMEHTKITCSCGFPPRPCTHHTYYIPTSYIEVTSRPGQSFFSDLPFANLQLKFLKEDWFSSGSVEMDNRFYHARVIPVPFVNMAYSGMVCPTNAVDRLCFQAMSEHISTQWKTGAGDVNDPQFKLWALSPKACLVKGAALAATTGQVIKGTPAGGGTCSYELPKATLFPPVTSEICGGWGTLLPRTGYVESNSSVGGALLAAERIRSIANEVYRSTAVYPDEKWQMIFPQSSSCFKE